MVERFTIASLPLPAGGMIGLCRLPGRSGDLLGDIECIRNWSAAIVVTLTEADEMAKLGAKDLGARLADIGIAWRHFPIVDYSIPSKDSVTAWHVLSEELRTALHSGNKVLLHCHGGVGRSGMIALRLMVELGEAPDAALKRLRSVRPGAVETDAQLRWAKG
jgi:protein-tyrosine phosphatase